MAKKKIRPPPGPDATLNELWEWNVGMDDDDWLVPRFRDLLEDAEYYTEQAQREANLGLRARHGRAAIVFAVAAVEAASNDALATVDDLFGDSWPAECIKEAPWCHFRRLSPKRVKRLIERGSLEQKVRYLLARVNGISGIWLDDDFARRFRTLVKMRNRIVHLQSLWQPTKASPLLNSKQVVHIAAGAVETAGEYVDCLEEGFETMNLAMRKYAPK